MIDSFSQRLSVNFLCLSLLVVVQSGCAEKPGPDYELAEVTGTITMDGEPMREVEVVFSPTGNGSLSFGTTDENGKYELYHNAGVKGCGLGEHIVAINKMGEPGTPEDTMNLIPPQYNMNSQMTADVKPQENTFDFDLTSNK